MAINGNSLSKDYALDVSEGKYDLVIPSAQYDRDNGQFECKIKEPGSGIEIHSKAYVVTILSKSLKETKLFLSFFNLFPLLLIIFAFFSTLHSLIYSTYYLLFLRMNLLLVYLKSPLISYSHFNDDHQDDDDCRKTLEEKETAKGSTF